MKRKINAKDVPEALGTYSHAILADKTLYISGQLPINGENEMLQNDVYHQTIQCLENIEAIIKEAKGTKKDIVKTSVFLKDLNKFDEVNEAYTDFFDGLGFPARAVVEVKKLPLNSPIEIEAIAVLD